MIAQKIIWSAQADHWRRVGELVNDHILGRPGNDEVDPLGLERLGGGGAAVHRKELERQPGGSLQRRPERTPVGLQAFQPLHVGHREFVGCLRIGLADAGYQQDRRQYRLEHVHRRPLPSFQTGLAVEGDSVAAGSWRREGWRGTPERSGHPPSRARPSGVHRHHDALIAGHLVRCLIRDFQDHVDRLLRRYGRRFQSGFGSRSIGDCDVAVIGVDLAVHPPFVGQRVTVRIARPTGIERHRIARVGRDRIAGDGRLGRVIGRAVAGIQPLGTGGEVALERVAPARHRHPARR